MPLSSLSTSIPNYWVQPESLDPSLQSFDNTTGFGKFDMGPDLCMNPTLAGSWGLQDNSTLYPEPISPLFDQEQYDFGSTELSHRPASVYSSRSQSPSSPVRLVSRPVENRNSRRLIRNNSGGSERSQASTATSNNRTRVPHSQVERKYRRALSAELERLRETIPHLVQVDTQSEFGSGKPSKATILASAIDYIKRMERDCQSLRSENGLLRDAWRLSQRQQAG
jgi:hypothetical protein